MKKRFFAALFCGFAFCMLTACDSYTDVAVDAGNTIDKNANSFRELTCVPNGGITPRLNPDGSIMVEKK